jgi:hypothetical protein
MEGHAGFLGVVGDDFRLRDDTALRLREVSDLAAQGDYAGYSIVFSGPSDHLLAQGTYELAHESLGVQSLFLVPLGPAGDGFDYEAVFTQLRSSGERAIA